ncbi:MAG: hypothetical protein WAL26_23610, partial [Mycobacterium sp.]
FTLTTPVEKALPAPKESTPSVDEKSGAAETGAAASSSGNDATAAKDSGNLKGGNLFTPGATTTKGGRHRADTGSFAQGVRDTIKGITGLGRGERESSGATSKSGESASSSSGSGSANSGGGSESK